MTEQLVPTVRTTPTMGDFAAALLRVWPEASKEAAGVIWAQFALETAGGQHCYGWNLGNVKHRKGDGYDYHALKGVFEFVNGKRIELTPQDPGSWFRALPSLDAGMKDHVEFVRDRPRYASAWPFVLAGDYAGYARELGRKGYYTASPDAYVQLGLPHFKKWMTANAYETAKGGAEPAPEPRDDGWIPIEHDGVSYLVTPYVVPFLGIGEAEDLAHELGCELPTPALVDAIYAAADVKINGWDMVRTHDGTPRTMASPEAFTDQAARFERLVQAKTNGAPFRLVAGAFKDVCMKDGKLGIYGWHDANGKPIQPFFTGHARAWKDYSQALRLVRRA